MAFAVKDQHDIVIPTDQRHAVRKSSLMARPTGIKAQFLVNILATVVKFFVTHCIEHSSQIVPYFFVGVFPYYSRDPRHMIILVAKPVGSLGIPNRIESLVSREMQSAN